MLDKKQYDAEMESVRKDTAKILQGYLDDNIRFIERLNGHKIVPAKSDTASIERVKSWTIPRAGRDYREVSREMIDEVYNNGMQLQHPRFFSFVTTAVSPYSVMGSVLSDVYNLNCGGADLALQSAILEEKLLKWMGELAGYADLEKAGGVFTSGGSVSNLTGIIAARESILASRDYSEGTAYVSDQTHSSVRKGLRMAGIRETQIRTIPTDEDFRMRTDLLREAVKADIACGKKPFIAVGTIATTNTGSIDPLAKIGDICEEFGMWFHIDGAFGGSVLLSDIYRNLVKGVEKADSFSWDFHKWALQTYSCSACVVKDRATLINAFIEHPEYLDDVQNEDYASGWDLGMEMSRPARHLKLWFTLQAMGTDRMADIIDYAFYNAKTAEKKISALSGWEIVSHASCGTLNFRYAPKDVDPSRYNELNKRISEAIAESGFAYMATTELRGMCVLRMCIINGNTTTENVLETIDFLDKTAIEQTRALQCGK